MACLFVVNDWLQKAGCIQTHLHQKLKLSMFLFITIRIVNPMQLMVILKNFRFTKDFLKLYKQMQYCVGLSFNFQSKIWVMQQNKQTILWLEKFQNRSLLDLSCLLYVMLVFILKIWEIYLHKDGKDKDFGCHFNVGTIVGMRHV